MPSDLSPIERNSLNIVTRLAETRVSNKATAATKRGAVQPTRHSLSSGIFCPEGGGGEGNACGLIIKCSVILHFLSSGITKDTRQWGSFLSDSHLRVETYFVQWRIYGAEVSLGVPQPQSTIADKTTHVHPFPIGKGVEIYGMWMPSMSCYKTP